jgi:hypothetical protein
MPNRFAFAGLLAVVTLIPILMWFAFLWDIWPKNWERTDEFILLFFAGWVLVLAAPLLFGGLTVMVGAALIAFARPSGRIVATVGATMVVGWMVLLAFLWWLKVGNAPIDHALVPYWYAGTVGALLHAATIAWIWRSRT